jgi:hypothetical protein
VRPTDILDKSGKGQEEIRTRKHKLTGKARMLLLLVDGEHPMFVLREHAEKLNLPADTLDALIDGGFVELRRVAPTTTTTGDRLDTSAAIPAAGDRPADSERFAHYTGVRRLMTESIFSALGLKGFLFTLKIEKTANLDDLRALIPEYERLMTKALGAEGGSLFVKRLRDLAAG